VSRLDGVEVGSIHSDLSAGDGLDVAKAVQRSSNLGVSFMGVTKSGPFDVAGELARQWLAMPNPHGRPNAEILYPSLNGQDLARRPSGDWIINFGNQSEVSSLYEAPYTYAVAQSNPKGSKVERIKPTSLWF
jgi:hypothetical protein